MYERKEKRCMKGKSKDVRKEREKMSETKEKGCMKGKRRDKINKVERS